MDEPDMSPETRRTMWWLMLVLIMMLALFIGLGVLFQWLGLSPDDGTNMTGVWAWLLMVE